MDSICTCNLLPRKEIEKVANLKNDGIFCDESVQGPPGAQGRAWKMANHGENHAL